jgi:DnaJ-class molecular chaperone
VASENGDQDDDATEGSHGPRECMPCRGTGRVISNLGGTQSMIECPWCEGKGMRVPGIDTQAAKRGGGDGR